MSFREKAGGWLKETTNKVVVSIITAGVLAVLALVYANKNVYAAAVRNFLFEFWREILLAALIASVVWLYIKVVKLEKKGSAITTVKPGSSIEEVKKLVDHLKVGLGKQESALSSVKTKIESVGDDVLYLKRDNLYQQARKHEQLNQRGALLCRLRVVELDIKDGNDYHLEESLEEVYSYVKKDKHFGTQDLSDAKNALSPIKNDGHKVIVEEILSQIKSKLV